MGIDSIATDRLLIREFKASDWRSVHVYASDPETVRYMDWGPNTESDTKAFVKRAIGAQRSRPRTHYDLAVTLRTTGKLVGACAILVNPARKEGDVGYCLNRSYWGRGYGTEAARGMLSLGFTRLALHRITGRCDPRNIASNKVLTKAGMSLEGRMREDFLVRGRWTDTMVYGILEREWNHV